MLEWLVVCVILSLPHALLENVFNSLNRDLKCMSGYQSQLPFSLSKIVMHSCLQADLSFIHFFYVILLYLSCTVNLKINPMQLLPTIEQSRNFGLIPVACGFVANGNLTIVIFDIDAIILCSVDKILFHHMYMFGMGLKMDVKISQIIFIGKIVLKTYP